VIPAVALAPLAVLPAYQRQGIGSALVRRGLPSTANGVYRRSSSWEIPPITPASASVWRPLLDC
jgi:hypothetical protein